MPRCDGSGTCSCVIHAGRGMSERGSGTPQDPLYLDVVTQDYIGVLDTPTIDMSMTGSGTAEDPRVISAKLIAKLGDLTDVTTNPPSIGQVLGWNGIEWAPQPAASAEPGFINTSGGVTIGDGSAGNPLRTAFLPRDFAAGTSGLELSPTVRSAVDQARADITALQAADWQLVPDFSNSPSLPRFQPITGRVIVQAGTAVVVSDSAGEWTFNLPVTYPNVLLSFVQSAGDTVYAFAMTWGYSRAAIRGTTYRSTDGQLAVNSAYRMEYFCIGW